jgi:transcriptional regulator with XRE-family HTH domain
MSKVKTNTEKLKELRIAKGLKQMDLSVVLGYDNPVGYNRIEKGRRQLSYSQALKLEEFYGVPHEEFFLAS